MLPTGLLLKFHEGAGGAFIFTIFFDSNPGPVGTINVGQPALGAFSGSPKLWSSPQSFLNNAFPIIETLGVHGFDSRAVGPMLAESWEVSPDGRVWTFKIREGVLFHKGFGEVTAEDVVWSFEQVAASATHPRASAVKDIFFAESGTSEILDRYTWRVDTGGPISDFRIFELITTPGPLNVGIVSKKQFDQFGAEEANRNTAATGPWQIDESRANEFWRMKAVENHWRQTPAFTQMVQWAMPEEATRIAAFQTGQIDTFIMSLDSIAFVQQVIGAQLMQVPNAGQAGVNIYAQTYVNLGTPQQWPGYDPALPWVSSDADTASAPWEAARKVREALSIAIDRQTIVDVLLQGYGHPLTLRDWGGPHEARLPSDIVWEYNPERAKQLLAEAGYRDGFSITLTPALRGAPAEVEACEAVAAMWGEIGVDVNIQHVPYSVLRPSLVGRTYQGATCHAVRMRLAPVQGFGNHLFNAVFSWGSEHPFLEERIPVAQAAVDRASREALELEIAQWMFDNVFGEIGLYVLDAVWPVGPKLAPWDGKVKRGDIRQINGYEYIQHR